MFFGKNIEKLTRRQPFVSYRRVMRYVACEW